MQKQQLVMQIEQLKKDREVSERRYIEMANAHEEARKQEKESKAQEKIETLRMQLEQMKKDRDAAEQKNAEQLEKLSKNCQNHDDDETIRNKSSINFETTTPEVVLQKQQLSVQN